MAEKSEPLSERKFVGSQTSQRILSANEIPTLSDFGILFAGITEAKFGFSWARLDPTVSQLLVTTSGEGEVLIGDKWVRLKPGSAYLTPSGAPHAYRALQGKQWTICWINYSEKPTDLAEFLPNTPSVITVPARQISLTVETAFETLTNGAPPVLSDLLGSLIHQSVLNALRVRGYQPKLTKLWKLVEADLTRQWTLDDLSKQAGMSREKLRRVCLAEVHRSPMHQVARIRFRRAAELLLKGEDKITVIAEKVGYSDPFTFSAAFKREMGLCPSRFR